MNWKQVMIGWEIEVKRRGVKHSREQERELIWEMYTCYEETLKTHVSSKIRNLIHTGPHWQWWLEARCARQGEVQVDWPSDGVYSCSSQQGPVTLPCLSASHKQANTIFYWIQFLNFTWKCPFPGGSGWISQRRNNSWFQDYNKFKPHTECRDYLK